jgi:peptide/nickel transport system permease protein
MKIQTKIYKDYLLAFGVIILLNFFLPRLLTGDPVTALAGEQVLYEVTSEEYNELIVQYGLDKPMYIQFIKYIKSLVKLDFGYSYFYKEKVITLIMKHLPWTVLLVFTGLIISLLIGYFTGIESVYCHQKIKDKTLLTVMILISGFPQFFLGMLLLFLFSVKLGWFPMGGCENICSSLGGVDRFYDIFLHMILPTITIVISQVSNMYLLTRNSSLLVSKKLFMRTAVAKGLSKNVIKHRYLGKNSFIPLLTMVAIVMGKMFVGVLMIEVVFSYPGIGSLIYESIKVRDYPILQASFFIVAITVLFFNGLAERMHSKYKERR